MSKLPIIIIIFISIVFNSATICIPNDNAEVSYILSIGGDLKKIYFHNNEAKTSESIIDQKQWSYAAIPGYALTALI